MSEMIERVATAIDPWPFAPDYNANDDFRRYRQNVAREKARNAIAAMREPTGEMIDAGAGSVVIAGFGRFSLEGQPSKAWRAMIDAALPAAMREGGGNAG
jgi:hypothetical protein